MKRLIVWCTNAVVAILCVLSITCYFYAAVWKVNVTYNLKPETLGSFLEGATAVKDGNLELPIQEGKDPLVIPLTDIVSAEGEEIKISLEFGASYLFRSFTAFFNKDDSLAKELIDENVDGVVGQLSPKIKSVTKTVVKSVAKQTVKSEVKSQLKEYLSSSEGGEVSDDTINEKLEELGFEDSYVDEKMDQLVESFYKEDANVDSVTEDVMNTVDEMYAKFQENTADKEEYKDFKLSEEDKEEIEKNVRDALTELADEEGNINPDDILNKFLQGGDMGDIIGGITGGKESGSLEHSPLAFVADAPASEEPSADQNPEYTDLTGTLSTLIHNYIPEEVYHYVSIAFMVMAGLMFLSMIPWIYILVKLAVKLITFSKNPTVKLALPIWLGWLFFLILVAVPGIAVMFLPQLSFIPADIQGILADLTLSVTSITWITVISAIICLAISIFYMIMRRQFKNESSDTHGKDRMEPDESDLEVA